MADKTQVFPLETNDSIRTRLTHSYEVSNLTRSIGMSLAFDHPERVFGDARNVVDVKRCVPAMLATIGLAHDIGNPPFGHQGEEAMKDWFKVNSKNISFHPDFLRFDGNPHGFRLLTRLQILNDDFGLNLTCGTLAAMIKYPSFSTDKKDKSTYKKFGVFESERSIIETVWQQTGLSLGVRHPFAHIMEACDDIAYAVIDAEDIVKKQFASFNDLIAHLKSTVGDDELAMRVIEKSMNKHETYKSEGLSSRELSEISMQMFRVFAVFELINAVTIKFVEDIDAIMHLDISADYELIKESNGKDFARSLKEFDNKNGFQHREVLELELRGHNHIIKTMDMLWRAIDLRDDPFNRFAYSSISENYRRIYEKNRDDHNTDEIYKKSQLLCDTISGMTDKHLIRVHNELASLQPHG